MVNQQTVPSDVRKYEEGIKDRVRHDEMDLVAHVHGYLKNVCRDYQCSCRHVYAMMHVTKDLDISFSHSHAHARSKQFTFSSS